MITKKLKTIKKNNNQPELFITADLSLASSLLTLGYEIQNLDKTNPHKAQFIFQRSPGLDSDIQNYWNGNLRINPRLFSDNIKMLKNRLYSA